MTQHLTPTQLELAARKLCVKRGQDPDQLVGHGPKPNPDGSVNAVLIRSPRWKRAQEEIEDMIRLVSAVEEALIESPEK